MEMHVTDAQSCTDGPDLAHLIHARADGDPFNAMFNNDQIIPKLVHLVHTRSTGATCIAISQLVLCLPANHFFFCILLSSIQNKIKQQVGY